MRYSHRSLIGDPPLLLARLTLDLDGPHGMFSLLASAMLENNDTIDVGTRVVVLSENIESVLVLELLVLEVLTGTFFFKGSVVLDEEIIDLVDILDVVLTRRGINDPVVGIFLTGAETGFVGDIITFGSNSKSDRELVYDIYE